MLGSSRHSGAGLAEPLDEACFVGDRHLRACVILNSLLCIAHPGYLKSLYPKVSERWLRQAKERELRWIESKREACEFGVRQFFSFNACCRVLGFDPGVLRERIRARGWLDGIPISSLELRSIFAALRLGKAARKVGVRDRDLAHG